MGLKDLHKPIWESKKVWVFKVTYVVISIYINILFSEVEIATRKILCNLNVTFDLKRIQYVNKIQDFEEDEVGWECP
jgi:hypothetical protein